MAYLFDLLLRRHGLPLELACDVLAARFWKRHRPHARRGARALSARCDRCTPGRWSTARSPSSSASRRHGGAQRPHQAAAAGGGAAGIAASTWSASEECCRSGAAGRRPDQRVGAARRRAGDRAAPGRRAAGVGGLSGMSDDDLRRRPEFRVLHRPTTAASAAGAACSSAASASTRFEKRNAGPRSTKCVGCHRCVTFCPEQAHHHRAEPARLPRTASWASDLRKPVAAGRDRRRAPHRHGQRPALLHVLRPPAAGRLPGDQPVHRPAARADGAAHVPGPEAGRRRGRAEGERRVPQLERPAAQHCSSRRPSCSRRCPTARSA